MIKSRRVRPLSSRSGAVKTVGCCSVRVSWSRCARDKSRGLGPAFGEVSLATFFSAVSGVLTARLHCLPALQDRLRFYPTDLRSLQAPLAANHPPEDRHFPSGISLVLFDQPVTTDRTVSQPSAKTRMTIATNPVNNTRAFIFNYEPKSSWNPGPRGGVYQESS